MPRYFLALSITAPPEVPEGPDTLASRPVDWAELSALAKPVPSVAVAVVRSRPRWLRNCCTRSTTFASVIGRRCPLGFGYWSDRRPRAGALLVGDPGLGGVAFAELLHRPALHRGRRQ